MKLYLDNCMFNRPFDDQTQIRIRLETEAKLYIQDAIRLGQFELIWSYILSAENAANPHRDHQRTIGAWRNKAMIDIEASDTVIEYMNTLIAQGIKPKDALHVACAMTAKADYFLTTDDQLLKKLQSLSVISAMNPVDFIREIN